MKEIIKTKKQLKVEIGYNQCKKGHLSVIVLGYILISLNNGLHASYLSYDQIMKKFQL